MVHWAAVSETPRHDRPPPRAKPGPKPRPPIREEDLFGGKYVRFLQGHLARLRAAHAHANRTLFFDDLVIAYLLAFFTPTLRSLRTMEDFSQTPARRQETSVDRMPRSTLSDANKLFDAALLEPIIEELRGRVPNLERADPQLGELTRRVVAADSSLFTVAGDVAWALRQRRANQEKRATIRLNLQWATAVGLPQGVSLSGQGVGEA